ncbi:hypothetical protein [Viridibacillus arvi]|uniref:hypothetical protein n=1 Tax=Viridibacillus arvi TaxID=263475 RepID=UPI0034CFA50E
MNWLADKAWDIIAGVFKGIWESISAPFTDLHGLKTLIFNKYEDGERVYGTFKPEEIANAIAPGVQSMSYIVGFFLVLGIIFMGAKISNTGLNPSNRTMFLEFMRDWAIVVLAIVNIGFLYEVIFMFNSAIVGIVNGELIDKLDDKLTPEIEDSGLVGWILIGLFQLGITIWANFYYIMRQLTLMVLMVLGPIFLALYIFPSQKGVTMAWLKEFFGTVMVQSVHAVTFFVIASIGDGGGTGSIQLTIMYLVVIPTGEAVRGLLNLGGEMQGKLNKIGAMAGMAGLSGMYGAVKSATSGKGFTESLKGGYDRVRGQGGDKGGDGESTSGSGVGPVAGTDTRASRMLKAGQIMSKGGKMAFGAGGSAAGAVMGPQGALIGGGLGTALGDKAMDTAGRLGFAAKDKIGNALEKNGIRIGESARAAKEDLENEHLADNLAALKTDQWANDNKEDFMKQHAGDKDAESKWNQALSKQRKQFKKEAKDALATGNVNPNYAKASDLAEQMAQEKLKDSIQKDGKDAFVARLPKDKEMSQEEIDSAWDNEKSNRLQNFRKQANNVAKKTAGNKPLDSFVDKEAFLDNYKANEMAKFDSTEKQFKSNYKKQNPGSDQGKIDEAWNQARGNQVKAIANKAENISKNTNSIIPSMNGNDRKASDLVSSAADSMTKDWAKSNEQSFKDKHRATGVQKIEQELEKDWDTKVSQVKMDNRNQAHLETNDWAQKNGDGIKAGLKRDNPNLTPEQLETSFKSAVANKLQENTNRADAQTQNWAQANKQAVTSGMRQEKMQGLDKAIDGSWSKAVQQQNANNHNFVSGIAQKVSGGQSLSAYVDKNQFANELADQRIGQAKENFKNANPHLNDSALEKAWQPKEKIIRQDAANAVASVNARPISKGYGTKTALASQFATQATESWANNPQNRRQFEDKFAKDFDAIPENTALKQSNPAAYQTKMKNEMGQRWGQNINEQFSNNMSAAENALLTDNSNNGVVIPHNVGNLVKGAKAFHGSMRQSSERAIKKDAFKNAQGTRANRRNEAIRAVYDHRYGADAPVEVKAKAYRDDVAYQAGVLRGVNGYQNKANKAMNMKKNPFANQLYQSAYEVADIARMAKTETVNLPNGQQQTRIAQGAVQLVVERDRSYIQVETKEGDFKTVSQYGAGDSDLEKGTVLFKDYNVENKELVPSSSGRNPNSNGFYAKDTAGHKISANRKLNIDANSLLQTRRQIGNQESEPRHNAYSFQVDQGQFDLNDIKSNSADRKAVLVVEQNRSYVAMTGNDNQMYRVSQIQEVGNSNLKNGQAIYKEYAVEGGQLRERSMDNNVQLRTYTRNNDGQDVVVDSSRIPDDINVNEMILPPKNRRFSRREKVERSRTKSGAYL